MIIVDEGSFMRNIYLFCSAGYVYLLLGIKNARTGRKKNMKFRSLLKHFRNTGCEKGSNADVVISRRLLTCCPNRCRVYYPPSRLLRKLQHNNFNF